jgi:hypothetical protein
MPEEPQMQTYYAKSMWTDPTNLASIAACLVGVLALPEVVAVIPLKAMPIILALSGALNFILRTYTALRPVANIKPTEMKPIEVKQLNRPEAAA